MSAKLTPFDKLRKRRTRKKIIKRITIIIILGICIYLGCIIKGTTYYYKMVNPIIDIVQNMRFGTGYPVELNASAIKNCSKMGGSVVVLSDDMISIINKSGYRTLCDKHKFLNPRAITNSNKLLLYDQTGNHVNFYSKTKKILEHKFDMPIYTANISDNDRVAVATGSNRYLSELEVWNNDYEKIFSWHSAEKYITSMAFAPNGKELVVACLGVQDGTYKSSLMIFNINKGNAVAKIEVDDVIVSVEYKNFNNIYVIYKHKVNIIDSKGNVKSSYDFGNNKLIAFNNKMTKYVNLIFDNYDRLANNRLVTLNSSCKEVANKIISGEIRNIDVKNDNIYILKDDSIDEFNVVSGMMKTYDVDSDVINFIATTSKLYTISNSEIDILDTDKNNTSR